MKVLIANRGEIAVRLIKGCKDLGFRSTAIYADEDKTSIHVRMADEAIALNESGIQGYLNSKKIVGICKAYKIDAVLPGYGFLSENTEFARLLADNGIVFAGPSPESIEEFGLKHRARDLAKAAGVPLVPGTSMITSQEEAASEAQRLGYPVMVKATAGGGGMGLVVCQSPDQLADAVTSVRSRGKTLFKDDGLFLEKYVGNARHIEGQVFGNGQGQVLWFGERECSVQRRHQKVVEESPSPFVAGKPSLREKLRLASTALAASVKYKSAGTIEYLVDDNTGEFYFLEMNTRLQVEHGVTELCYGTDLVKLMLLQAQAEINGKPGLSAEEMQKHAAVEPKGHAIEVRVYAENPAADYKPAPGLFVDVSFPEGPGIRVDTWLERGSVVTPHFDPLLAKIMTYKDDRSQAITSMQSALASTLLAGPPTNKELLQKILESAEMCSGATLTNMLDTFTFEPHLLEFKDGGTYTTVQDFPGRIKARNGVPVAGPMDNISLRVANLLVGNEEGIAGFEITYSGPTMLFHQPAVIAVCGASMDFKINGVDAQMWARLVVPRGAEVVIGSTKGDGCRAYLAILGGLPNVGNYLGSKSTVPALNMGGYQGRTIRAGDVLVLDKESSDKAQSVTPYHLPSELVPVIDLQRPIYTLAGPFDTEEFLTPKGREEFFKSEWKVGFSSGRTGIRLDGSPPEWARTSGGEGGSHPSNVLGYGYPIGGLSFTGNSAVIFTADSPLQSGFICLQTVLSCELWRLGQLKAGEQVRFSQCTWGQAMDLEKQYEELLDTIRRTIHSEASKPAKAVSACPLIDQPNAGSSVLYSRQAKSCEGGAQVPRFLIRQAGDRGLLCDFGLQEFDLRVRLRAQQIVQRLSEQSPHGVSAVTRPHTMSVLVNYDAAVISQTEVASLLVQMEATLSDSLVFHGKTYYLPMVFDPEENKVATQRYMETQRPYATYLPDNIDFIRRNNGLKSREDVLAAVEKNPFLVLASSGYLGLPVMISIDPRKRFTVPKANPSRTITPAGALGTGGNTSAVYPTESPGGYMLWGLTLPGAPFDTFGLRPNYTAERPWLFEPFDQIVLKAVSREDFDMIHHEYQRGTYKIDFEDNIFSVSDYDALVERTKNEVSEIQKLQKLGAATELAIENKLLEQWRAEQELAASIKAAQKSAATDKDALDDRLVAVKATMNARIWKINVKAGDEVPKSSVLLVLEAMKMEIPMAAPENSAAYTVSSVVKEIGDIIEPGDVLITLKPKE